MKTYGRVDVWIYMFLTSALVGGERSATRRDRFTPGKELSGPQSWSGRRGENSWSYQDSNSDLSVVQPVASRYTDYAIPAPAFILRY
jgi:hypothetical protein